MQPDWKLKRDPEHQPVRFLEGVWQQQLIANFGSAKPFASKEFGQLKSLRKALGDLTQDVIEWMVEPGNWFRFCQQVRAESGLWRAPDNPHIGFLLAHHGRALKFMHSQLRTLTPTPDFVVRMERLRYEQWKTLLLAAYAEGKPERLAKIEAAKTLTDIQLVFIEMVDESTAA